MKETGGGGEELGYSFDQYMKTPIKGEASHATGGWKRGGETLSAKKLKTGFFYQEKRTLQQCVLRGKEASQQKKQITQFGQNVKKKIHLLAWDGKEGKTKMKASGRGLEGWGDQEKNETWLHLGLGGGDTPQGITGGRGKKSRAYSTQKLRTTCKGGRGRRGKEKEKEWGCHRE